MPDSPVVLDRGRYGYAVRWPSGFESAMPDRETAERVAGGVDATLAGLIAENSNLRKNLLEIRSRINNEASCSSPREWKGLEVTDLLLQLGDLCWRAIPQNGPAPQSGFVLFVERYLEVADDDTQQEGFLWADELGAEARRLLGRPTDDQCGNGTEACRVCGGTEAKEDGSCAKCGKGEPRG